MLKNTTRKPRKL